MAALAKEPREQTGAVTAENARIKLAPLGTPMRAQARAHSDGRLVLEAELPWLQLGAQCTAELPDGRSIDGTVHWIGLDMTRSGTARLRILVNTAQGHSIQLSVSDADVQELMPAAPVPGEARLGAKRFRWMLPMVTAILAGSLGWLASNLSAPPKPKLLAAGDVPQQQHVIAPPPIVKIPAESVPMPAQEIAVVMTPTVAPALPAVLPAPEPQAKPVAETVKKARMKAAGPRRRSSKP